jgi:hypothetical protein
MILFLLLGDLVLVGLVLIWFVWKKTRTKFTPGLGTEELLQRLRRFLERRGYDVPEMNADRLLIQRAEGHSWVFVNSVQSPLRRSLVNDYALHSGRGDHYILTNHPVNVEIRELATSLGLAVIGTEALPEIFPVVEKKN